MDAWDGMPGGDVDLEGGEAADFGSEGASDFLSWLTVVVRADEAAPCLGVGVVSTDGATGEVILRPAGGSSLAEEVAEVVLVNCEPGRLADPLLGEG